MAKKIARNGGRAPGTAKRSAIMRSGGADRRRVTDVEPPHEREEEAQPVQEPRERRPAPADPHEQEDDEQRVRADVREELLEVRQDECHETPPARSTRTSRARGSRSTGGPRPPRGGRSGYQAIDRVPVTAK